MGVTVLGASLLSACEPSRTYQLVNDSGTDVIVQAYSPGDKRWRDLRALPRGSAVGLTTTFGEDGCTEHLDVRVVDGAGVVIKTLTRACINDELHVP